MSETERYPLVAYHANCSDGFGSAWAASKALPANTKYVPVTYGAPYPAEIDRGEVSELYLLDFSYPLGTLDRLEDLVESLTIIDHHATAEETLRAFRERPRDHRKIEVIFEMNHSGAVLAWRHFHNVKTVPSLLLYVQDRDLWRHALPNSREINAALRSYPMEFEVWDNLNTRWQVEYASGEDDLFAEGWAILRAQAQQVEAHVKNACIKSISGYEVPVVNATVLMSEIGEALCEQYPERPFSATYFVNAAGEYVWSLRSRHGFDVSVVAKGFGGGGHPAAAGFTWKGPSKP